MNKGKEEETKWIRGKKKKQNEEGERRRNKMNKGKEEETKWIRGKKKKQNE